VCLARTVVLIPQSQRERQRASDIWIWYVSILVKLTIEIDILVSNSQPPNQAHLLTQNSRLLKSLAPTGIPAHVLPSSNPFSTSFHASPHYRLAKDQKASSPHDHLVRPISSLQVALPALRSTYHVHLVLALLRQLVRTREIGCSRMGQLRH
jgi:hypothetical protein